MTVGWPSSRDALVAAQEALGRTAPPAWRPLDADGEARTAVGGCFVCFPRGKAGAGAAGDRAWAAAAVPPGGEAVVEGRAGVPYERGLLALREGPVLEAAVRALARPPDVLLVDAPGGDHPRRAGLALH